MIHPFRIFIGYDPREAAAYHVAAHSILRRASLPVSTTPLALCNLTGLYHRPHEPQQRTEFSFSRFLVPALCGFKGWALYMDSDVLVRCDVAELAARCNFDNWYQAAFVVKHDYMPKDGAAAAYPRKNWSSVILFNNELCRRLTPEYVNTASGLELHRFQWLPDAKIGALPREYNHLVGEYTPDPEAKIVHYTRGGPWQEEFADCEFGDAWRAELADMLRLQQPLYAEGSPAVSV